MRRLLAVSLAVFGALAFAVSDQAYLTGETALIEAANGLPALIGWPLRAVMHLGTVFAALLVIAGVAWLAADARRATLTVALAAATAFRLDNVFKDLIDRPRPPAVVEGLDVRESISGFGFPSGHTTMAFALAATVHPVVPGRWRWLLWVLATLVGVARMHVGVHWPADVVGGAALGTAVGTAAWLAVRSIGGLSRRDARQG